MVPGTPLVKSTSLAKGRYKDDIVAGGRYDLTDRLFSSEARDILKSLGGKSYATRNFD